MRGDHRTSLRTTPWPAGIPCWVDLSAPHGDAAGAVHAAVLGWEATTPAPGSGGYRDVHVAGDLVAGLVAEAGATPGWTVHVASDDVEATAAAATAAGGTVVAPPVDVGPLGRMLLVTDPAGALVGAWQAGTHTGSALVNAPQGLTREDLRSPEPETSRAFDRAVFGWEFDAVDGAEDHTTARCGEPFPIGGPGPVWPGRAPGWLPYVGVADARAAAAAATAAGGSLADRVEDTPHGVMTEVIDPWGARFAVLQQHEGTPRPDRSS